MTFAYIFQIEYVKDGDAIRHHFTLPADIPELKLAKQSTKNASDVNNLIYNNVL